MRLIIVFLTYVVIFFSEKSQAEFHSALIVPPSPQWHGTKQMGVAGNFTNGMGITTDSAGNVYITGNATGGLDGHPQIGELDLFIQKYNFSGVLQGTKLMGMKDEKIWGDHITTDSSGNVYVTGIVRGTLPGQTNTGGLDIYILKYNRMGVLQWTRQMGNAADRTYVSAITTDHSGNIYISGCTTSGQWPHYKGQLLIQKFNPDGTLLWTKMMGTDGERTEAFGIAIDRSGYIYITGFTSGRLFKHTHATHYELFIQKYNANGVLKWSRQMGLAGRDTFGQAITEDHFGNIYITGYMAVDSTPLKAETFIQKYNSKGVLLGTRQMGVEGGRTQGLGIATDASGNVFLTGITSVSLYGQSQIGKLDLFVQKYSPKGALKWAKQMGVEGKETIVEGITANRLGDIFITGYTYGGLAGNILTGKSDLFIQKYNTNGVLQ